jgi:TonB family protein
LSQRNESGNDVRRAMVLRSPRFASLLAAALAVVLVVLVVLAFSGEAHAQGVPAGGAGAVVVPPKPDDTAQPQPKAPVIVRPVVKKNEGAAYPKQALDEGVRDKVVVKLVLDVDATGIVTGVRVLQPMGHGFDEAAVAAAQKLEFSPATKDGKPFAAVIPFAYEFTPPPAALSGRVVTAAGERPIAGATVVVRDAGGAEKTATTDADGAWRVTGLPAGKYHVTVSASGRAPSEADEDLAPGQEASAIDRLAAAAAGADAGARAGADAGAGAGPDAGEAVETVEVRGTKPPREVSKFTIEQREMNRIPGTGGDALRSLQNLPGVARPPGLAGLLIVRGSAPQDTQYFVDGTPVPIVYHFGGLSSVVPTEILDRIDFYPGNYSSQYGRALGGIVDVGLRDPKKDKIHGMAEVDLIDVRALAEGPIGKTGWTFAIGGRRSWFDLWLGPVLTAAGAGVSVAPVYYDYQAMAEKDLGKRSSIRFAVFGSDDLFRVLLKSASASNPQLAGTIGSHMGFFRVQALYRNKLSDETELRAVAAAGADFVDFDLGDDYLHLATYPVSGRVEVAQRLQKHLIMNTGVDMIYTPYQVDVRFPAPPKAGQPPGGPFLNNAVQTSSSDSVYWPAMYTEFEAQPWVGTRIVPGLRVDYAKNTKSWDVQPRLVVRQDLTREPRRTTIKAGVGVYTQPPQPNQTDPVFGTLGLINERSTQYDVGLERQLTDHVDATVDTFYKQLEDLTRVGLGSTGSGDIYGMEVLLRYKPDERFFGWLAYTLSRSERRDQPGAPLQLFQFDETHILTVLGSYRLGRGWEIGARFRLTSGYLYTPQQYGFYDENSSAYIPLSAYPTNGTRLPLFHSLDIRIDKGWKYKWGNLSVYLDVLNVYNQGNVLGVSYDYNSTHSTYANDLPFLPSLGIRAEM